MTTAHEDARVRLVITVMGKPAGQGSKRAVPHRSTGKIMMLEASKRTRPWKNLVRDAAQAAIVRYGWQKMTGPLCIKASFVFDPPATVRGLAREWPITRSSGDLDKLVRAVLDALGEAGVYGDDSQVVGIQTFKHHSDSDDSPLESAGLVVDIFPAHR